MLEGRLSQTRPFPSGSPTAQASLMVTCMHSIGERTQASADKSLFPKCCKTHIHLLTIRYMAPEGRTGCRPQTAESAA